MHWLFFGMLLTSAGKSMAADPMMMELGQIQQRWAVIKYQTGDQSQTNAFEQLAQQAHVLSERYPARAEPLVWESIVLSSHAGTLSGLAKMSALNEVKQARDLLLAAEKLDPNTLDGSVYTSLGTLYYKVPGWPFGFGSNKKAQEYLQKALALNPDGIDPNFFYGELLYEQGKYDEAMKTLQKAQQAPPRPARELADRGRHREIDTLIAEVKRFL
jgi:tetratricopeptide (TPR) repeat protein